MTAAKSIRIVHAGDLSTREAFALTWLVGETGHRLQEIAICDGRVVGSWIYAVESKGRDWWIESSYTEVARRFRRRGLAVRLWHHGIARWRPLTRIESIIGSREGMGFLARMSAELAYSNPGLFLEVKVEPSDHDSWQAMREWAAHDKLRELGKVAPKTKRLVAMPTLQLAEKAAS